MDNKPYVLMIDDDKFFLNDTEIELQEKAFFKGFRGPNDFELEVQDKDISAADLIIVDYEFKGGTATKSKLAPYIRDELGYKGKMILCSLHADGEIFGEVESIRRDYDAIIHKRDLCWETLRKFLPQPEKIQVRPLVEQRVPM